MKTLPKTPQDFELPPPSETESVLLSELWNKYAPRKYRGMVDAVPVEFASGGELWTFSRGEYVRKDGVRVGMREARDALREFVKSYGGMK